MGKTNQRQPSELSWSRPADAALPATGMPACPQRRIDASGRLPAVLTCAGSDSSGGAGIQADLKTIAAHLLYGESVICALTAQNTRGVDGVMDVPAAFVRAQMESVFSDIIPAATKVGMVSTAENMRAVAEGLAEHGAKNVVVDPVMVATSGGVLMREDAMEALCGDLFAVADLVTPNVPEAQALSGLIIGPDSVDDMVAAARAIALQTQGAVLVKGGHQAFKATDVLLLPDGSVELIEGVAQDTANTHGTGCTLSSSIACWLACGLEIPDAVRAAKAYLSACLAAGLDLGAGSGPVDHMAPVRAALGLGARHDE